MIFFKLVFGFGSFTCASFDLESKIQTLCNWSWQRTHQGGDWETKWFVSWFIYVMSNWLSLVWIWIRCISVELTPDWVIQFGETWLLVLWSVGSEWDMTDSDEDRGSSRWLGAEDRGWLGTSRVFGDRTIRRLGDVVCDPHRTRRGDKKRGVSGLASKSEVTIY
jgi:hypothetical protein